MKVISQLPASDRKAAIAGPAWSRLLIPAVLLVLAGTVAAHVGVASIGDDYRGLLAPLDVLFNLELAFALALVAFLAGGVVCRLFGLEFTGVAEESFFSTLIGGGAMGLAMLGLGLAELLQPLPVCVALALLLSASQREALLLPSFVRRVAAASGRDRNCKVAMAAVGLLIVALIAVAASPPHDFDEAIYHLAVARLFVVKSRVYPMFDNSAGNMPLLAEMDYTICLMAGADLAAKFFSMILGLVCAMGVYAFSSRFVGRRTALIAMFGFFAAGMVIRVATTARVDVTLTAFLFASMYALIVHLETSRPGWLYASAVLAGLALGIKYTAAAWIGLLAVIYLIESFRPTRLRTQSSGGQSSDRQSCDREAAVASDSSLRDGFREGSREGKTIIRILSRGFMYAVVAAAVASPWYIKNQVWFHNPVYPFITGETLSAEAQSPIRYFDPEDDQKMDRHFQEAERLMPSAVSTLASRLAAQAKSRQQPHPLRVWDYYLRPDLYSTSAERGHNPNLLFLLFPLAFLVPRKRWLMWFLALSAAFYLSVVFGSWVARYLLPIYPLLTIASVAGLVRAFDLVRDRAGPPGARLRSVLGWGPAAIVAGALLWPMYQVLGQMERARGLEFVTGAISRRQYMDQTFYYPAIDVINHQLPETARVMMLGAQMSYDLRRDYIADVSWEATDWKRLLVTNDSMAGVYQELRRRGVTHILFSPGLYYYAAQVGPRSGNYAGREQTPADQPDYYPQLRILSTFALFSDTYLQQIYSDQHRYYLYSLK